jgi:hypothetical protein
MRPGHLFADYRFVKRTEREAMSQWLARFSGVSDRDLSNELSTGGDICRGCVCDSRANFGRHPSLQWREPDGARRLKASDKRQTKLVGFRTKSRTGRPAIYHSWLCVNVICRIICGNRVNLMIHGDVNSSVHLHAPTVFCPGLKWSPVRLLTCPRDPLHRATAQR